MHVITIAAKNYLPFVRVLASSFVEFNSKGHLTALIVDAHPGEIIESYPTITPFDLNLDKEEFYRMATIYDVTELSTALKPWALQWLLNKGCETACYLDPDIQIFSDLSELIELTEEHEIVLTPHTTHPIPIDNQKPSERDILGSGIYNLGFISISQKASPMLDAWKKRLLRDAIIDLENQYFTDQRWIDFVPACYQCLILKDPGYNVAYWNLQDRRLDKRTEGYKVNGYPLRFMHFSGYNPNIPWLLCKYTGKEPRVLLSEKPLLRELCDLYAVRLKDVGYDEFRKIIYKYNTTAAKDKLTKLVRRWYRDEVLNAEQKGETLPPHAFDYEKPEEFIELIKKPLEPDSSATITSFLLSVWKQRTDLQAVFPDPIGAHASDIIEWARVHGVAENILNPRFLPETPKVSGILHSSYSEIKSNDSVRSVNIVGYLSAELGVGQSARLITCAAQSAGLKVNTFTITKTLSRQEHQFTGSSQALCSPVNILVINADQLPQWVRQVGKEFIKDRYTIAVWAWELQDFPGEYFSDAFQYVDEIWAISEFSYKAISKVSPKPVYILPNQGRLESTLCQEERDSSAERLQLKRPTEKPYFLFMFDYLSSIERKNPMGVVDAFCSAFSEEEGPDLVIKSINSKLCPTDRERLLYKIGQRNDIILIEDYLTSGLNRILMAESLCYISLHRSEGYGLTLSEAMTLGLPVIATAYSGNLDFMNDENSLLVPYKLIPVPEDAGPYTGISSYWADPDLSIAAGYMRKVYDNPDFAESLGLRAKQSFLKGSALEETSQFIYQRVMYGHRVIKRRKLMLYTRKISETLRGVVSKLNRRT